MVFSGYGTDNQKEMPNCHEDSELEDETRFVPEEQEQPQEQEEEEEEEEEESSQDKDKNSRKKGGGGQGFVN